jgi:murein DD-endopeptidase MepM/ murein hydrolase activator NlpD
LQKYKIIVNFAQLKQSFLPLKGAINDTKVEAKSLKRRNRYNILRQMLIGFIVISLLNMIISQLFYTPKMHIIASENRELVLKYEILQSRIASMQSKVAEIRHRDHFVYRPLFSSDSLAIDGVFAPYADSKYANLTNDEYSELMKSTWLALDAVTRQTYALSRSLDEVQTLAKDKEQMSLAIPAIWPIDRSRLRGGIGAFGYRIHPILKYRKMHQGVDLGGKIGDPIYTTGNGIIETVILSRSRTSNGTQIVVNHGFGYKTRYAHLDKVFVQQGDTVSRGELIAEMGNTGISTAPHLHYEVIYKGSVVNPINYFDKDMSTEAYKSLMGQIQEENYEGE